MRYEVRVGVLGWIDVGGPWPIRSGGSFSALLDQAASGQGRDNSKGIMRTYMGLMATANTPPVASPLDFKGYEKTKNFRAMIWARLAFDDGKPGQTGPVGASYVGGEAASRIVNPGYTPPVDLSKVGVMGYIPPWLKQQRAHVADQTPYPAEASPLSEIYLEQVHPNSVLGAPAPNERLVASGLLRFRAGPHTDAVGLSDANSQYHVPWVWAEFQLTSLGGGRVRLRGASSQFPTVAWYLGDVQQQPVHRQTTDSGFHYTFLTNEVETAPLVIWPVLAAGAPRSMPEPSLDDDAKFKGQVKPVTQLPYTCPGQEYISVYGMAQPAPPGV